jgi:hypothetical protein
MLFHYKFEAQQRENHQDKVTLRCTKQVEGVSNCGPGEFHLLKFPVNPFILNSLDAIVDFNSQL